MGQPHAEREGYFDSTLNTYITFCDFNASHCPLLSWNMKSAGESVGVAFDGLS